MRAVGFVRCREELRAFLNRNRPAKNNSITIFYDTLNLIEKLQNFKQKKLRIEQ